MAQAARTVGFMADVIWRPTADSTRNLAWFWGALGASAGSVAILRAGESDRRTVATVLALAALGGALVAVVWNRRRVMRALDDASRPRVANLPRTPAQRAAASRAANANLVKVTVLAVVVGLAAGLVPVVGPGVAAAGVAGVLGSLVVWRTVRRFERDNAMVVLTASRDAARQRQELVLGLVSQAKHRPRPSAPRVG